MTAQATQSKAHASTRGAASPEDIAFVTDLRISVARLMRRLRSEYEIPTTQAAVLGRLMREGDQYIGELAAGERVRPQSMSQTLAELETLGLIERGPDANDGRRTKIALTEAGRTTVREERLRRDGWLAKEIATFTPEEQQVLEQAAPLLERLAQS
jgi:DNA-binding MarR family transcriptional regulator